MMIRSYIIYSSTPRCVKTGLIIMKCKFVSILLFLFLSISIRAVNSVPDAKTILDKTLASYTVSKSYQGEWTYTIIRGKVTRHTTITIRSRGNSHLFYRVAPLTEPKGNTADEGDVPSMLVVLDGKSAWFANETEKVYFRITLPKKCMISPIMFFPMLPTGHEVSLSSDSLVTDKSAMLILTWMPNGGVNKLEIDPQNYHIRKITADNTIALQPISSSISVDHEIFNAEIADKAFTFHALKGAREIPAPPGVSALFGPGE